MTSRFTEEELFLKYGRPDEKKYGVSSNTPRVRNIRSVQYLLFKKNQERPYLDKMTATACYGGLFQLGGCISCDTLFAAFLPWMWERNGTQEWTDWVVNESFFKDVFITKDVDVWQKYGGFVRTDVERHMMEGALTFLREGFDEWVWDWYLFVEMGYTPTESYALARHAHISTGSVVPHSCNTGHTLINAGRPFGRYGFDYVVPSEDKLSEGYQCKRNHLNSHHFDNSGSRMWENFVFPETARGTEKDVWGNIPYTYPVTKKNLDTILKTLQKLK